MMLSSSARVSQWTAQKLSATASNLVQAGQHHVVPLHPAWTIASRRFQHTIPFHTPTINSNGYLSSSSLKRNAATVTRYRSNVARLYARRLLEIAAASAASHRVLAEMEQAIDRPADWKNWQRRDWTDELLQSIGRTRIERVWSACSRIVSLTAIAAPMTVLVPASYVSQTAHEWSWKYALWGIEQAGPTFLKLVQWATTRQDLFSPEFCQYFGKLRDQTQGHHRKHTERILREDLGDSAAMFDMEKDPIGSGCIAQVYRGTLKEATGKFPKGTVVAVKVQHPGIWQKVCLDFYILGKLAKVLEDLPRLNLVYLALSDTVRQFRDIMLPQLDLTLEAKHLNRFNRDFADDETVSFPQPLSELTTTRVLTETFVEGTPILDFVTAPKAVRKELALLGLNTTLRMIFVNDMLHGDLRK